LQASGWHLVAQRRPDRGMDDRAEDLVVDRLDIETEDNQIAGRAHSKRGYWYV